MSGAKTLTANCLQYELEIAIDATAARVWHAIFEETNAWWLPDFHMAGADSVVTFDPTPGGKGLQETNEEGGRLLWFQVQYYLPQEFKIYLVGHLAPDFGGPATTHLKLAVEPNGGSCVLKVTDALHGHVSEQTANSLQDGWHQLFGDGLKTHIEN